MKCMEENKKNADREQQAVEYNHQNTSKIDKINNSFSCNLKKKKLIKVVQTKRKQT